MSLLAANVPLTIEQGATFELPIQWLEADGSAKDISGLDFAIQIRPSKESSTVLIEGSYDGGTDTPTGDIVISEDGVGGTITLYIAPADTAALDFTRAVYDLEVNDGTDVQRLMGGPVTLSKEVTR